jgi:hypothetical protein
MRIIDHRQFQKSAKAKNSWQRYALYSVAGLLACIVLVNVVMWGAYRNRVLPGYNLGGAPVGNVAFTKLQDKVAGKAFPQDITLTKGGVTKTVSTTSLGASVDIPGSIADLKKARPVLPMMALFTHHTVPTRVTIDQNKFKTAADGLTAAFTKDALMRRVAFNGSVFTIAPAEPGYKLAQAPLSHEVATALQQGKTTLEVPVTTLSPATASTDLDAEVARLGKKLTIKTSFVYKGRTVTPTVKDIGGWYAADFNTMKLSAANIGTYIDTIAPSAANRSDLVLAIQYAFNKDQPLNVAVVPAGSPVHTYCTAVRDVSAAALDDMIGKLAATYADTRGWNAGGKIAFQHVDSGCSYTVWLSAASDMTSFGSICDSYYNCQVGNSVVVNNDRWTLATDPWNATGASLEDYRTLIIDHETGHRLGFYDDPVCPATGGPAPVMMQQSIDLHGCTFNRWPTAPEISAVLTKNGL